LESYNENSWLIKCQTTFLFSLIVEVGAFVFTFFQCFFIFKYCNIVINHMKNIASLGLCHLVCTNFCVCLRAIVDETFHEISHNNLKKSFGVSASEPRFTRALSYSCKDMLDEQNTGGIHATKELIEPYIYPCVIEYSLLCLTVFYIIWENLDKPNITPIPKKTNESRKHSQQSFDRLNIVATKVFSRQKRSEHQSRSNINNFTVDCSKSTSGLFFGLFILLMTIISLIVYFVYKTGSKTYVAVLLIEILEIILVCLSLVVIVPAFYKLKQFGYIESNEHHSSYNETLSVMALAGIYLFSFFSIIAILSEPIETVTVVLALCIHILCLIEGTIQTAFIIDGLKRCSKDLKSKKEKPARSLITVLLLINLSLWLAETLSIKKYDMNRTQVEYYNIVFWSIISSVSTPLAIFFRFHSSVCLSDIWKELYQ
jgi:hypothetical protein